MKRPTVTAILNVHREGMIAKPSLASLERADAQARQAGHEVEAIAVLDRADCLTRDVVAALAPKGMRLLEVDFGDLGKARNFAVAEAAGRYVAFLDADDLWGSDWLASAIAAADERADQVVWHPEVCLFFGATQHLLHHVDMETEAFRPAALMIQNYWTALSFAARDLYLEIPYPDTDLREGFGFEDWSWNMMAIEKGAIHKVVPGTGHVIRRKSELSLSRHASLAGAVPRGSRYIHRFLGGGVR